MNIGELRELIKDLPDSAPVYFWVKDSPDDLYVMQVQLQLLVKEGPAEISLHLTEGEEA